MPESLCGKGHGTVNSIQGRFKKNKVTDTDDKKFILT